MSERKVALVIDGMTAVGSAICRRLQQDGCSVVLSYPPHQRTPEAWLAAQRDDGFSFTAIGTDAADGAACIALVGKLLESHGRLDVLVNLAALSAPVDAGGLGALTPAGWAAALRPVIDCAYNINKQALPSMLERQWGRIIQVASEPARPQPEGKQSLSQSAANAALQGLTRALALEVARHGVTVNTIVPGYLRCRHGMAGAAAPDEAQAEAAVLPQIPVGRLGEPEELAGLVSYLASDSAAFVTGAQIAINGGYHMA